MTERYGRTKVSKIRAAYNDLRDAVRAGRFEEAEAALDRYEPWADYVFSKMQNHEELDSFVNGMMKVMNGEMRVGLVWQVSMDGEWTELGRKWFVENFGEQEASE